MTVIRWILGIIILSLDFLTRPKPMKRDKTTQERINKLLQLFNHIDLMYIRSHKYMI